MLLAVMAFITVNGTWKISNPWTKSKTPNPHPTDIAQELRKLKEAVRSQAEMIKALEARESLIIDVLGDVMDILDNS